MKAVCNQNEGSKRKKITPLIFFYSKQCQLIAKGKESQGDRTKKATFSWGGLKTPYTVICD